jgi:hypothetical protein
MATPIRYAPVLAGKEAEDFSDRVNAGIYPPGVKNIVILNFCNYSGTSKKALSQRIENVYKKNTYLCSCGRNDKHTPFGI